MRRKRPATRFHAGRRIRGRALRFERLEGRALLSAVPLGAEFRVNTFTTNNQSQPEAAMDADGDFVVAWSGSGSGDTTGIFAQRFNAAGVAQGSEFLVNTHTTNTQSQAAVAMDADGDFVVVWASYGQDGSRNGVYAKRYNLAGVVQGGEFRVSTYTTIDQQSPAVAMDSDGDFVVTWSSDGQDGNQEGVYAQRYNAAGVAQGAEFRVNTYTTSDQNGPDVALDADGDFVVAWISYTQDGSNGGIYARRYNAAGTAQGSEFRVNTFTTGIQVQPAVAMDSDGDFVVSWDSFGQENPLDRLGIYAQRYNASGVAQGAEFRVNTFTTDSQTVSDLAMDADGDFVIAWHSVVQDPGGTAGVYAQAYNAAGAAQGGEFRVNTYTTNSQGLAGIAMESDGDFVVVWRSVGQDGSLDGVYSQRYLNNALPTTSGIANVNVSEDAADSIVNLWAAFADAEDADSALTYAVQSNTNPALFTSTNINAGNGRLTLDYAPNAFGSAMITVRATDTAAEWVETTFTVNAAAVNDEQVVGFASMTVDRAASVVISAAILTTVDIDNIPAELVYTVTAGPIYGTLLVNGTPAGQFTQQDVNNGLVYYQNDGSEHFVDGFNFTVDDGAGLVSGSHFGIAIEPHPGDYHRDYSIDAADYVMWRKQLGATSVPAYSGADGDGNTAVEQADYGVWTAHFGETVPGAGSGELGAEEAVGQAVPEVFAVGHPVGVRHSLTYDASSGRRIGRTLLVATAREDGLLAWVALQRDYLQDESTADGDHGDDGEAATDDVFASLDVSWEPVALDYL